MNTILAHQVKHSIKSSCLEIRKMIGEGVGVELKFWPNTWLYISQMKESKTPGTKSNKLHQFIFTLVYIPKKSKVNQFFSFLFAWKGNIIISTYKQFLQMIMSYNRRAKKKLLQTILCWQILFSPKQKATTKKHET